jgi:hypothetical protein
MVRGPLLISRQYVSAVLRSAIHGLLQISLSSRDPRLDHLLDILQYMRTSNPQDSFDLTPSPPVSLRPHLSDENPTTILD